MRKSWNDPFGDRTLSTSLRVFKTAEDLLKEEAAAAVTAVAIATALTLNRMPHSSDANLSREAPEANEVSLVQTVPKDLPDLQNLEG
jgi:hypothetical protein